MDCEGMTRYKEECKMLAYLAKKQLNLDKNKIKPNFETLDLCEILYKMHEEFKELEIEVVERIPDYELVFNELGDLAACLVGLIAWVNNKKEDIKCKDTNLP